MNYLQLCQEVHLILRVGEETPGTQPAAVAGQTGVLAEMVQWVKKAHRDICNDQPWDFMRGSGTFTIAAGQRVLTKADMETAYPTFGKLLPFVTNEGQYLGLRASANPSAAELPLEYVPYQQWQGQFDAPPIPTGMPTRFTIAPDRSVEFDATPEQEYLLRGNFVKQIVDLTTDSSVPMFDDDYHAAIVWWAIVHYYCPSRDGTNDLRVKATAELRRCMARLFNEQLPDFTIV